MAAGGAPPTHFDYGAAADAVANLVVSSRSLEAAAELFRYHSLNATDEWYGRFREVFDVESAEIFSRLTQLSSAMFDLGAQARALAELAREAEEAERRRREAAAAAAANAGVSEVD